MSRTKWLRMVALAALALPAATGCWEQWSVEWWPQMKWQKVVQAYEETGWPGYEQGFTPPDGTLPVGATPSTTTLTLAETEALLNPQPASLESLENGREQFDVFCSVCHGPMGHGDGLVAGPPFGRGGPLVGVLPIGGPTSIAKGLTDGHIYTTISQGRGRMPNYRRIPTEDRWDIVNYVRYLNGQLNVQGEVQ